MARLIDADALILALETQDYSGSPESLEDWTPQDLTKAEIADINNAPTIDAVEVVRCIDCKYNYANQIPSGDGCQLCVELPISKDFFCAYGEVEE